MPRPCQAGAAAILDKYIYLTGGRNVQHLPPYRYKEDCYHDVLRYDITSGEWTTHHNVPDLPVFRHGHACLVMDKSKLVVVGGTIPGPRYSWVPYPTVQTSTVLTFDLPPPKKRCWWWPFSPRWRRSIPPMYQRRSNFGAAVNRAGSIMVVAGGNQAGYEPLSIVEQYRVGGNTINTKKSWTRLPDLPGKRVSCASAFLGSKYLAIGGSDQLGVCSSVLALDISD